MTQLAHRAARAEQQMAARKDARTDAMGEEDEHGVVVLRGCVGDALADHRGGREAEQTDGHAEAGLERRLHRHSIPADGRVGHRAGMVVDEAGHRECHGTQRSGGVHQSPDFAPDQFEQGVWLPHGRERFLGEHGAVGGHVGQMEFEPDLGGHRRPGRAVEPHQRSRAPSAFVTRARARLDRDPVLEQGSHDRHHGRLRQPRRADQLGPAHGTALAQEADDLDGVRGPHVRRGVQGAPV